MINPTIRAAPTIEPITIPAIAPPDNPLEEDAGQASAFAGAVAESDHTSFKYPAMNVVNEEETE